MCQNHNQSVRKNSRKRDTFHNVNDDFKAKKGSAKDTSIDIDVSFVSMSVLTLGKPF